jgi:hypothetical protein
VPLPGGEFTVNSAKQKALTVNFPLGSKLSAFSSFVQTEPTGKPPSTELRGGVKFAAPIGPVTLSGQLSVGQRLTPPMDPKVLFDLGAALPISPGGQSNEVKVEPYVQVKSEVPLSGGPTSFDPSAGIKASAKLNEDTEASLKFQWGPKNEEMLLLQLSGQL